MKITYKLTKDEYLEALQLHQKGGLKRVLMGVYIGFAVLVILIGTDFSNTREIIMNMLALFFAVAFYLLLTKIVGTFQSKKLYDKSTTLSEEVTLRITGKGIKVNEQSSFIAWDTFSKYKENEKYYILYLSMNNFKILPKSAMNEQEQKEFAEYLDKYLKQP